MSAFNSRGGGRVASFTKADAANVKLMAIVPYKQQAQRFLNTFWQTREMSFKDDPRKEEVWESYQLFVKLDRNGETGNELDEFNAHRVLESTEGALTVQDMRRVFAEVDVDHNHMLSLTEFLLFRYHIDWHLMTNRPVTNNEVLNQAQQKVDNAQAKLHEAIAASDQAAADEENAIAREEAARVAEQEVADAKAAQATNLAAVEAEENKIKRQIEELEAKGEDETLGVVTRNKAKAELAQLRSQDSLPLRRSKIGLEAAVRRVTKALKVAAGETMKASFARREAEASRLAALEAVRLAEEGFQQAEEYLQYCKENCHSDEGTIWWMDRELEEAKKFMPRAKVAKLEAEKAAAAAAAAADA